MQVTASGVSARLKKIMDHPNLPVVRDCGWRIEIHGWRKSAAGRYVQRIIDVS